MRFPSARRLTTFIGAFALAGALRAADFFDETFHKFDWSGYLKRQDLVWERMPTQWTEAPFLGNGMLGLMMRQDGPQTLRWDVGRSDVQEHRDPNAMGAVYARGRLNIGSFQLRTRGRILGGDARLDLWNAEASGTVRTDQGAIRWRSYVHASRMLMVIETSGEGGEKGPSLEWRGDVADPVRALKNKETLRNFPPNPPFVLGEAAGGIRTCVQDLLEGGQTATAWLATREGDSEVLEATVMHTFPERAASHRAVAELQGDLAVSRDQLRREHQEWWHRFYPKSFLALPDSYWTSFYWIQLYKLASATRGDRALIDNQGPWLQPTPWPAVWWNLNVQLSYWPTLASNHPDLMNSLADRLDRYRANLAANAPQVPGAGEALAIGTVTGQELLSGTQKAVGSGGEAGNLIWALHDYWMLCRYTLDNERLLKGLFPLLRGAVNYYLPSLQKEGDGLLHIPMTRSPEYPDRSSDANYDLALLRWALETLLALDDQGRLGDPLRATWKEILGKLAPYPVDSHGYMIARSVPFAKGHRHFSHLFMIFPLHLIDFQNPEAKDLACRSIEHWQNAGEVFGYSLTGAASMYAAFGDGEKAWAKLNELRHFLQPNTLYREAGPVIETPLSAAQTLQDMVLQSWGGRIRIFPAVPAAWPDIAFHDMLAEGRMLVSAIRNDGKTRLVRVTSLSGGLLRIVPGFEPDLAESHLGARALVSPVSGEYEMTLHPGETITLAPRPASGSPSLRLPSAGAPNPWGLKADPAK